ncbi:MAG: PhaM family polyhydroxyalkanoate granule multifunctional regulatory protein [Betaproteobacteria bacterium]
MAEQAPGVEQLMEMFQKLWNPMAFPLPSMFQPTLDPAEVEKRIADLQVVKNWLEMNLNLLQMSIKTLEMQKSALDTRHETARAASRSGHADQ